MSILNHHSLHLPTSNYVTYDHLMNGIDGIFQGLSLDELVLIPLTLKTMG